MAKNFQSNAKDGKKDQLEKTRTSRTQDNSFRSNLDKGQNSPLGEKVLQGKEGHPSHLSKFIFIWAKKFPDDDFLRNSGPGFFFCRRTETIFYLVGLSRDFLIRFVSAWNYFWQSFSFSRHNELERGLKEISATRNLALTRLLKSWRTSIRVKI